MYSKEDAAGKILFIAYHSISSPIMESQGFTYIKNLSKKGLKYYILTFETKNTIDIIQFSQKKAHWEKTYNWKYLYYHKKPRVIAKFLDIICGIFAVIFIIKKYRIKVIHTRGLIAAIIAFLPAKFFTVKILFDTRGLLADKYVGGNLLRKSGILYKLIRQIEDLLLKKSDCFTVETFRHAEIIKNSDDNLTSKIYVIPSCVDLDKFNYLAYPKGNEPIEKSFKLVYLGKIGTWYLLNEMLDFFDSLSKEIDNSSFTFLIQEEPESIYIAAERKHLRLNQIIVKKPKDEEIPILLAQVNLGIFFINPYKRYNSSPIKFGEYLASGLPVVVNSGIGDTEFITEKENVGIVIKEFSPDSYGVAIQRLKNLFKEQELLRSRCRLVAEKYLSLEIGCQKYFQIYQRLLN